MANDTSPKAYRYDPYRTFRFQVCIDGKVVAGLRKMTALKKTTEAVAWRTAGDPTHERKFPGSTKFEPITLEQGLTLDTTFEDWANQVNRLNDPMSLAEFRKNVIINVMNVQGEPAVSYKLLDAWVSEYQALPDLDAGTTNAVGIHSIKLEHEGWERDLDIKDATPRLPRRG
ncbi:MAG: phage tail protein [Desulfatitalea sp.]|nr:phage tail protein [Desulfatitalea sp.]NNK02474.1 phage tail protein [Desulfatitalea sp.]